MPRQTRQTSGTGIYHVMMRGINHQDIFEDSKDFWKFLQLLDQQVHPTDELKNPLPPKCIIYAYCLMTNHVHLLIRECEESITEPIRKIAIAYAQYYNYRHEHSGHLFQDRFKSEPVNDMAYFITLLRYIHQNPVAGGIVRSVGEYTWSSWREYEEGMICQMPVCNTEHVFSRISRADLTVLVNEPLSKTLKILDFDNETNIRLTDEKVREYLASVMGTQNLLAIQQLPKKERNRIIQMAKQYGASIRQLNRLTGISEGIIRNIKITQ